MIAVAIATTAAALTWLSVSAALMSRCRRSLPATEVPDLAALRADLARRAEARAAAAAAAASALPAPRTSPEDEPVMPAFPVGPAVPAPRSPRH